MGVFMVIMLMSSIHQLAADPPCNCKRRSCSTPVNCSIGIVWDHCYCCRVCAKDQGELCGGKNYAFGECAKKLECVVRNAHQFLNRFHESHDELIGRCEPYSCLYERCPFGQRCFIKNRFTKCDCNISCTGMLKEPVCGETNRKLYRNECELRKDECRIGRRIGVSISPCSGTNISIVSCTSSKMQLSIRRALLGRSARKRLVLNDPQCRASLSSTQVIATTLLDRCGTRKRYTISSVIYSNTLRTLPPRNALIIRGKTVNINFECEYLLKKRTKNPVRYTQDRPHPRKSMLKGRKTRSLKNGMFVEIDTTRNYTVVLSTLRYTGLNIRLIPHYCYVIPFQYGIYKAKFPIIDNGCPTETNVRVDSVSDSRIVLKIPGIRFKKVSKPGIIVRCKTKLCFPDSRVDFAKCAVNCKRKRSRRRRSLLLASTAKEQLYDLRRTVIPQSEA